MKEFEIISYVEGSGVYQVELRDFPRCTIAITDLSIHTAYPRVGQLPRLVQNVTDGENTNYHYEIAVISLEDEHAGYDELKDAIEECWDWFLSYHLL